MIAAALLKAPELAISDTDAKQLAKAIKSLMAQYSIAVSAKSVALMQFAGTAAAIYTPRAILIAKRKGQQAAQKKAPPIVTPVNPQGGTGIPGAFDVEPPPVGSMKYN